MYVNYYAEIFILRFYCCNVSLNDIQNGYMMGKVKEQLDRCDRAWELSELAGDQGSRFQCAFT
ncbi:hypothetical protein [Gloeocapsopsis dulcis]|uniref:hypothetical protein n=1 Tax=Gloeocapsopsis dulcis TaxID=2859516 RepID=UPI00101AE861|nr:hypothetical protein [Gloeocapsopsis dulcis]WNN90769.1 hypothetical protein P0S91_06745 [Gloeocapsopsis dulcis]